VVGGADERDCMTATRDGVTPVVPATRTLPDPYGPVARRALPALDRAFKVANRAIVVPLLRAGAGPLLANPLTGSMMLLRTRGRRSGAWREAPLGYVIRGGRVYCCAGFGDRTQWLRNLLADPRVEVRLPGGSYSGTATLVTDPAGQVAVLRELMGSMPLVSRPLVGDLRDTTDAEVLAMAASLPLVRIDVGGVVPGPWDPGGRGWIALAALGVGAVAATILARRRKARAA
jgi:deazaflavin-dependent oxidoreductase (nitroreductase family)